MDKKKKKGNPKGNLILFILIIVCVIIGFFAIKYYFIKMNKAAIYSQKILNLYINSK